MNCITTASGKFYSGMTAEVAKQQDLYKSKFSRDFNNIDKNKDGVLSDKEILMERKSEAKKKQFFGVVNVGILALDILSRPLLKNKKSVLRANALDFALDIPFAIFGSVNIVSAQKIKKENIEIEKRLNMSI